MPPPTPSQAPPAAPDIDRASGLGRCDTCIIRHKGICNALTRKELEELSRIAHRRSFQAGQRILSSEEGLHAFAAIYSGVVKLTKILIDGRQQIVGLLFPPDCLGRSQGATNAYFAEAATDVELCCFPERAFECMLDRFPGLNQRLLQQTWAELDEARDWMVLLGRKTAEERVASLFLMLATRAGPALDEEQEPPVGKLFELHLKRAEIADFLGLTLETVSRQITALKKSGVIAMAGRRRFSVTDFDALARMAG